MKKRIVIAGIGHETNTYCRDETFAKEFHQMRGERILRSKGMETGLGGALFACEELDFEVVPLLVAGAQPSGTINRDTYDNFKEEILSGLEKAGTTRPIDGIYLELHGAGVVAGIEDLEGDLAVAIREQVGEAMPITASFDLHGNITQRMADALDGIFACHQYPHIDMHLRAEEAVHLIDSILNENFRPVSHVETLPLLLPTTTTFQGIGKEMLEFMLEAENEQGVIDISWFHGFPYTDVKHVGSHIVVTTCGDREQAKTVARNVAGHLWRQRELFRPLSLSAEEAVALARSRNRGPVVVNETSDNCGGGAPGDGTHLLRAMLDAGLEKACFAFIVDPEVADKAHEAGVGKKINVDLGGKYDDLHGETLKLDVYVKALHDGRLIMQGMGKGSPWHIGKTCRLVIDGIDIVVASRRSQTFDPGPFEAVGINVLEYPIVALKSSNHFRAGFGDIATEIITADPPGLTTHHIEIFPRDNKPGAMWPLDENAQYG